MKARGLVISLSVLVLVGGSVLVGQTSAADKTTVTATEKFDPFGVLGPPVGAILSPGTLTCPGHDPTGNPMQPCPEGSNIHIRGNKRIARLDSSDPRVNGWNTVESNLNWDAEFTGPVWGTFSLQLDAGGAWDGSFRGSRRREGGQWITLINGVGHGTGGAVEGMQIRLVDRVVTFAPQPLANIGSVEGRILDPHSN